MALQPVKRRALLLPLLALAHGALVMIAIFTARDAQPVAVASSIEASAVAPPIPPTVEPAFVEINVPGDVPAPDFEIASALPAPGSGDCDIADQIRTALLGSPETQAALATIPPESRTVTNAIMLWDGRWTTLPRRESEIGLDRLRQIVVTTVRAAPPGCQVAANRGPRLIIVPERAGAAVLAFGSGVWHWSEVTK